ncbi:transposase [Paenibacillus lautus]|uniref:transposase n=1 Tax=Paenibacillus lautus TaxID=1401 RepID=UPI003D2C0037
MKTSDAAGKMSRFMSGETTTRQGTITVRRSPPPLFSGPTRLAWQKEAIGWLSMISPCLGVRSLIRMHTSRKKDEVVSLLQPFSSPERTIGIAIDMWEPYKLAIESTLLHVYVVIDAFHLIQADRRTQRGSEGTVKGMGGSHSFR